MTVQNAYKLLRNLLRHDVYKSVIMWMWLHKKKILRT